MEDKVKPSDATVYKIRFGVSVDPEEYRIAQELAMKKHGDNVSRLVRHLLRSEWEREQAAEMALAS